METTTATEATLGEQPLMSGLDGWGYSAQEKKARRLSHEHSAGHRSLIWRLAPHAQEVIALLPPTWTGFLSIGDRGDWIMTITGLLIVGAIGYGLWYLGGAFCKWRTQKFFNSRAWDPSREKLGTQPPQARQAVWS